MTKSTSGVIHSAVSVKDWMERIPSVEAVRPALCPYCQRASRVVGQPLSVYGHGLRRRLLRGPGAPGESPREQVLYVRRYLCLECGAVLTVVPAEVVRQAQYPVDVIAMALTMWSIEGQTAVEVRRQVSSWQTPSDYQGWPSLRRWAWGYDCANAPRAPARQAARRFAERCIGHCPPESRNGRPHAEAFFGARRMMLSTALTAALPCPPR